MGLPLATRRQKRSTGSWSPSTPPSAVVSIAREVRNRWYAPVLGVKDSEILAIYSHAVVYGFYIPDSVVGHLVSFQVGYEPPSRSGPPST